MSRSRKKNPYSGLTGARSEKQDKRICNRKMRRHNRARVAVGEESEFLSRRQAVDVWAMDKDGKVRFDPDKWPEMMRK